MYMKNLFLLFSFSAFFTAIYAEDKTFEKSIADEFKGKMAEKIEEGKSVINSKLFKKKPCASDIFDKLVKREKLTFEDKVLAGKYGVGGIVGLACAYFVSSSFLKVAVGVLGGVGTFYIEEKLENTKFVQEQLQKFKKEEQKDSKKNS